MVEEAKEKKETDKLKEESKKEKVNLEVFGGLKRAAERGEDLKNSMMTFYRSGYAKEEIEDAARLFLEEKEKMKKIAGAQIINPNLKDPNKKNQIGPQKASKYGKEKGPMGDKTTIFLIATLILLVLILVSVFLFKSEMVDFFNKMFG